MTDTRRTDGKPTLARVGLRFKADSLDPRAINQALGLDATRAYVKGELSARTKTPYPWGGWALEFEADDDVEPAARRLLEALAGKHEIIGDIARQMSATVTVSIWWEPEGGQGGYTLSSEALLELARLGERVDFYFA